MSENKRSKLYPEYYEYELPFDPTVGMDVFKEIDVAPEIEDVDEDFKKLNCYKGDTKIMACDVDFPYRPEHETEFEKCMNDVLYFIVNYCKIITLKDGLQLFKLFQYQKNTIKIVHENRFSIFKFPRQMGKALIYNTFILTTDGFKKMEDIKTGDYVFGDDGKPTKVIYKTEPIYEKCYKITFDNGEEITAGANHDWKFYDSSKEKYVISNTDEMFKSLNDGNLLYVDHCKCLTFESVDTEYEPFDYVVNHLDVDVGIDISYIMNDWDVRINLLNALLYKFSRSDVIFSIESINHKFTKDVRFLLASLGYKSKIINGAIEFTYSYIINDKFERLHIESIVEVPTEASYCISVDNESHLFLVGETLIPTHNCTVSNTNITIRINGSEMDLTVGQLYDLIEQDNKVESYTPNYDYQILTEDGFKDFDGITTRTVDEIYEVSLSDGTKVRATPKHEIKRNDGTFVQLSDLVVGDNVGVELDNIVVDIQSYNGEFRVADMISVRDTHSFAVNNLSAIMSNCIDGDSMVTLLDNHTGKIFQIHINKLFDYLYAGA